MKYAFQVRLSSILLGSALLGLAGGCQRAGYFAFRPAPAHLTQARPAPSAPVPADSLTRPMEAASAAVHPVMVGSPASHRPVTEGVTRRVRTPSRRHSGAAGQRELVERVVQLPPAAGNTARHLQGRVAPRSAATRPASVRAHRGQARHNALQKMWNYVKEIGLLVLPFIALVLGIVLGITWLTILGCILVAGIVGFILLYIIFYSYDH